LSLGYQGIAYRHGCPWAAELEYIDAELCPARWQVRSTARFLVDMASATRGPLAGPGLPFAVDVDAVRCSYFLALFITEGGARNMHNLRPRATQRLAPESAPAARATLVLALSDASVATMQDVQRRACSRRALLPYAVVSI